MRLKKFFAGILSAAIFFTASPTYAEDYEEGEIVTEVPTEILYADGDKLISHKSIDNFVKTHNAKLTIMNGGEHWFHTEEQIAFLNNWLSNILID